MKTPTAEPTMKKINNRWYDENNNSWSANLETEESALAKSKTLISCSNCIDCRGCIDCRDCIDCSNCSGCSGCRGCSYCKTNPQRYVTPKIGSRNSQTSIYWTTNDDVQIICGCWKGNIDEFEKRVRKVHATTEHLQPYLKQIEIFKMLVL